MSSEIVGIKAVNQKLLDIPRKSRVSVERAVVISGKQYETELKRAIQKGSRSGQIYKRRNVTHQASAPGEAPKTDTGRLVNSIDGVLDDKGLSFDIFSRLSYARYLEFGTAKTKARPIWHPLFRKLSPQFTKIIGKSILSTIKKFEKK